MRRSRRIFLSYARADEKQVHELYDRLEQAGLRPWMDQRDIPAGTPWREAVERALRTCGSFVACLSRNSVHRPGMLQEEILTALEEWRKRPATEGYIFPVRLEPCELPETLSAFQALDLYNTAGWRQLVDVLSSGGRRPRNPGQRLHWRMLIIEDDDSWRSILSEKLNEATQSVNARSEVVVANTFQTGREALDIKGPWDLCVVDIGLPAEKKEKLGRHLTERAKSLHIPCIVVSGDPRLKKQDVAWLFTACGICYYFDNSEFDGQEFTACVARLLASAQPAHGESRPTG